jgi:hypothetical protein
MILEYFGCLEPPVTDICRELNGADDAAKFVVAQKYASLCLADLCKSHKGTAFMA